MIRSAIELGVGTIREVCRISSTGEALGEVLDLTSGTGLRRFAVHHEQLQPGRRASSPHAHSEKEEFVYVLRGRPTLWIDGKRMEMRAHDSVAFSARTGLLHYISNDTADLVEYLVVSTPTDADMVTYGQAAQDTETPS